MHLLTYLDVHFSVILSGIHYNHKNVPELIYFKKRNQDGWFIQMDLIEQTVTFSKKHMQSRPKKEKMVAFRTIFYYLIKNSDKWSDIDQSFACYHNTYKFDRLHQTPDYTEFKYQTVKQPQALDQT